ncbi:GlxA family transcriptional regulator [Curvivirga sp.]|uniref:GlxA family transcriptional regulator n=1 Tax=Curvivirga sp. TaxID=2856848 RepID=UPI003B5BABB1
MSSIFKEVGVHTPDHITIVLVPDFCITSFSVFVESMRFANQEAGETLYKWDVVSTNEEPVRASNGLLIQADMSVGDVESPSNIVVCSGMDAYLYKNDILFSSLRRWERNGAHMGALGTGSYLLAHAGLLAGYSCTIHWTDLDSFYEKFPNINVETNLFTFDRKRFTCGGGTAALDMMLKEIEQRHGSDLADLVSKHFMHERMMEGGESLRLPLHTRLRRSHPKVIKAVQEMEKNIEEVLERPEIATRVGLSMRQLERLFQKYLGTTPVRYYLNLRLGKAKSLLTQTSLSITEIAFACGFNSGSHFSKCYQDKYGKLPTRERLDLVG